jgi:acyl carrier protein
VTWGRVLELTEKIKSIVADSFDLPYDAVTLDTGPSNTVSWDSFGQMDLVLNIEKEFDITLEFDEIFKIVSTQTLLEVVENKLDESRK